MDGMKRQISNPAPAQILLPSSCRSPDMEYAKSAEKGNRNEYNPRKNMPLQAATQQIK
ncbi:hypothetical protein ACS3UN_08095 [Oscillospiraceae bacterium LTW-04]|nr:hypothetical protein RBH76_02255 [Oscillospiraceae bacterium MB24-C1]